MEIQWSLVLFTALGGSAGWLFGCLGFSVARKDDLPQRTHYIVSILTLVLLVVGALISVTHLSHPERIMAVFGHPTTGIFTEAAFVGVLCVLLVIYIILVKRQVNQKVQRAVAIITALVGVVFTFMLGYSYIMSSRDAWDTITLPLGYLGTSASAGAALYAISLVASKAEEKLLSFSGLLIAIGAVLSLVFSLLYGFAADVAMGEQAVLFWVAVVLCGGVACLLCGLLIKKKPSATLSLAVASLVLGFIGCAGFRVMMWLVGEGINYFGTVV